MMSAAMRMRQDILDDVTDPVAAVLHADEPEQRNLLMQMSQDKNIIML